MRKKPEIKSVDNEGFVSCVNNAMFVYAKDAYRRVFYDDILWIEASGSYCDLNLENGEIITVSYPLEHVTSQYLPSSVFFRIHRSYTVNLFKITMFMGNISFIGKSRIPISHSRKKDFLSCLNIVYSKRGLGEIDDE